MEEARQIAQPVLSILGGESEALWGRFGETHRWILDSLAHAEGVVLLGTTHFPQIERPRPFAEALAAFFTRHPLSA
jgi:pimeloyl-ACP methyl ester carboxylesterase